MPSDKLRLYVALYARGGAARMPGGEDRYHWALIMGPKTESPNSEGTRYHAKNVPGQMSWMFEQRSSSMGPTNMILVRILIGKVANPEGLAATLSAVPVNDSDPSWNCVHWVQTALVAITQNKGLMGRSDLHWDTIRATAMAYCEQKLEQGQFSTPGLRSVPTYNLLEKKETV